MINLLGDDRKRVIQMTRVNSALAAYSVGLVLTALLVAVVYGVGFWVVANEKQAMIEKIASDNAQAKKYASVEREAEEFKKNLAIAKQILRNEIPYSSFLTTLASDMPSGAIITNLSLSASPTPIEIKEGLELKARTTSYAKVLETKAKLENSELFENVSIVNVVRPDDFSTLTGQESRYPYDVSFNLRLTTAKEQRQ